MSTQRTWWQSLDVKQRLKFVIYALLLINFAHYIGNDVEQAQHTFHSGWRWYDWTSNFATTLDELGWFVLLFLLLCFIINPSFSFEVSVDLAIPSFSINLIFFRINNFSFLR